MKAGPSNIKKELHNTGSGKKKKKGIKDKGLRGSALLCFG